MADNDTLARLRAAAEAYRTAQAAQPQASFTRDVLGRGAIGQGALLGFGDEIEAGARALMGENYDEALTDSRRGLAAGRAEYPVTSTVAELGGALVPSVGAVVASGGAAAPAAAGALGRLASRPVLAGAASGAVGGAVQGFGEGEGGLGNRLDNAAYGALTGGAVGGALGAVAPMVANAGRRAFASTEDQAADRVLRGMAADGTTPAAVAREFGERQRTLGTFPETVADLNPRGNTAGILDAALAAPGDGRDSLIGTLIGRNLQTGNYIADGFAEVFGRGRGEFFRTMDALDNAQRAASAPLYQRAYSVGEIADPQINTLLTRLPQSVFRSAADIARIEGASPAPLVRIVKGEPRLTRTPTMRDLDMVKRGLDDAKSAAFRAGNGSLGHALSGQRELLLKRLDDLVPDYRAAREAWAGPARVRDAAELGRKTFDGSTSPHELSQQLAGLSASEKDGFLSGLLHAVETKVARVQDGQDPSRALKLSDDMRDRLRTAVRGAVTQGQPDEIADNLIGRIERVRQMHATTRSLTGGSQTAQRQAFQADGKAGASMLAAAAGDMLGGGGLLTAGNLARMGARKVADKFEASRLSRTNGDVLRLLGGTTTDEVTARMAELTRRHQQLAQQQANRGLTGARAGLVGGIVGGGSYTSPQQDQPLPANVMQMLLLNASQPRLGT